MRVVGTKETGVVSVASVIVPVEVSKELVDITVKSVVVSGVLVDKSVVSVASEESELDADKLVVVSVGRVVVSEVTTDEPVVSVASDVVSEVLADKPVVVSVGVDSVASAVSEGKLGAVSVASVVASEVAVESVASVVVVGLLVGSVGGSVCGFAVDEVLCSPALHVIVTDWYSSPTPKAQSRITSASGGIATSGSESIPSTVIFASKRSSTPMLLHGKQL